MGQRYGSAPFRQILYGDLFEVGKLYTIFGYDVYLGEALLTIGALLLVGLLGMVRKQAAVWLMTGTALCFIVCITVCFGASLFGHGAACDPSFVPDSGAVRQILAIAVISPWAFIGFESISHASEEFSFKDSKLFRLLVVAVASTNLLYVFVIFLSAWHSPPGTAPGWNTSATSPIAAG